MFHQRVNVLSAQIFAAQTPAGAAGLTAGRCKAVAGFGLFGLVKHTGAKTDDPTGMGLLIQSNDSPADRGNADVQSNSIGPFHKQPTFRKKR